MIQPGIEPQSPWLLAISSKPKIAGFYYFSNIQSEHITQTYNQNRYTIKTDIINYYTIIHE